MSEASATTRSRLLAAAREEFTARGVGGARVDRIAAQAGVNKERIYGHFGSKEKLFHAVIADAVAEHINALGLPTDSPAEYVGRIYDFHREHPQLLRLMQWEMLHYGQQSLPDEEQRAEHYAHKVDALAKTLGVATTSHTAASLVVLIGLAAWPHALPQLTRLIVGTADDDAADHILRDRVVEVAEQAFSTDASIKQVEQTSEPPARPSNISRFVPAGRVHGPTDNGRIERVQFTGPTDESVFTAAAKWFGKRHGTDEEVAIVGTSWSANPDPDIEDYTLTLFVSPLWKSESPHRS